MKVRSASLSFKIGLGFHALNNEGGGGTNVMEGRRIAVGDQELDGLSGEIVRRHVLENFIRICEERQIPLSRGGKGLLPDRGKTDLVAWMNSRKIAELAPDHYPDATRHLVESCALRDVGGYLMALEEKSDKAKGTLKRDSTFEVSWLITGHDAATNYTQHAAYHPSQEHNLFTQNMRTGIYAGVARFDLARVGRNDWAWWDGSDPQVLSDADRKKRALALLDAWEQFLLSPSGAKQAGWLQHTGLIEGAIFLSADGPAPFLSPLALDRKGDQVEVRFNDNYRSELQKIQQARSGSFGMIKFDDQSGLLSGFAHVRERLSNG